MRGCQALASQTLYPHSNNTDSFNSFKKMNQDNVIDSQSTTKPDHVCDWMGKDDPENPRNFSLSRRISSTVAVTFLAFVSTITASLYSPGHDQVSQSFSVSNEIALLPLAMYNLGMALGPMVGAPMSETYGRKVVFLVTTPVFGLFTLGAGLSQSIASLVICRFFAGVFASPAISNASATITDYTASRYRANSLAFYYSIPFFGAVLGPLIGGFVVQAKGWRWTQWTTLFFLTVFYVPVIFTKETYKKTILQGRAKRLGVEGLGSNTSPSYFLTTLFVRPIHMLFTEPIVTLICLYNGFVFGLMYTFVVASPWVFEHYYGFDLAQQSLSFLGLMIGTVTAPLPIILMDLCIYQPRLRRHRQLSVERFPAENRLFPAMLGSLLLPMSLFAFAWTVRPGIHWICAVIFQGLAIHASLLIYASASLFMLDAYGPLYGASAAGAAMLSRYTLSAAFPLFSLQMYRALGVGWATSVLAFCAVAMAPIPWAFWALGQTLRKRSKYETSI